MKKSLFIFLILLYVSSFSQKIYLVTDVEYPVLKTAREGFLLELNKNFDSVKVEFFDKINENIDSFRKKSASEPPDMIVSFGNSATQILIDEKNDIPILFCMVTSHEQLNIPSGKKKLLNGVIYQIPYKDMFVYLSSLLGSNIEISTVYSVENFASQINEIWKIAQDYQIPFTAYPVQNSRMVIRVLRKIKENSLFWLLPDNNIYDYNVIADVFKYLNKNKIKILSPSEIHLNMEYHADIAIVADPEKNGQQAALLLQDCLRNNQQGKIEKPKSVICYLKRGIQVNTDHLTIPIKWID